MTPLEKRAIELEAHRQTYWRAMRETCADIRRHRRMGWHMPWAVASDYRLLRFYYREWREARNAQAKVIHINSRRVA